MAGLTSAGFEAKRLEDIQADTTARAQAEFGANVKTGPSSVLGHFLAIFTALFVELWEQGKALFNAFDPNNATGAQLDNIAQITGVTREPATFARGTVMLTGTSGTPIAAGKLITHDDTGDTYVTLTTVTIGGGTVDVDVRAEESGAKSVAASASWTITTPVTGWDSVSNAAGFTPGADAESDESLRARRLSSLQIISVATDSSIRAKVLALDFVTQCLVLSNRTLTTDVNGIPGKAFRTIVWPSSLSTYEQDQVASVILETMPAGIEPDGAVTRTATDAQGFDQDIKFSFATAVSIYARLTLTTNSAFPGDGNTQVQAAVEAYINGLGIGDNVIAFQVLCAAFTVPGVEDAVLLLDTVSPPVASVNIIISVTQIATVGLVEVL